MSKEGFRFWVAIYAQAVRAERRKSAIESAEQAFNEAFDVPVNESKNICPALQQHFDEDR